MGIYKGRGAIHPGGFTIQRGQSVAPTASQRSGLRIPCAAGYGYFLGIMIGFAKGGAGIWQATPTALSLPGIDWQKFPRNGMKRWIAVLRFTLGSVFGILGFGTISTALFPFRGQTVGLGILLLIIGTFIALGTLSPLRKPKHSQPPDDKKNP